MATKQTAKPKILLLGPLHYVPSERLEAFQSKFDLHVGNSLHTEMMSFANYISRRSNRPIDLGPLH